jgi:hypothetical protein
MSAEPSIEVVPGSLLSYAYALFEAARQNQIEDDDHIGLIEMCLTSDVTEVHITSEGDHTQTFGTFKADLVNLMNKCGDAVITSQIEMKAGPDDLVETQMKPEDPETAMFLLNHDVGKSTH